MKQVYNIVVAAFALLLLTGCPGLKAGGTIEVPEKGLDDVRKQPPTVLTDGTPEEEAH